MIIATSSGFSRSVYTKLLCVSFEGSFTKGLIEIVEDLLNREGETTQLNRVIDGNSRCSGSLLDHEDLAQEEEAEAAHQPLPAPVSSEFSSRSTSLCLNLPIPAAATTPGLLFSRRFLLPRT